MCTFMFRGPNSSDNEFVVIELTSAGLLVEGTKMIEWTALYPLIVDAVEKHGFMDVVASAIADTALRRELGYLDGL